MMMIVVMMMMMMMMVVMVMMSLLHLSIFHLSQGIVPLLHHGLQVLVSCICDPGRLMPGKHVILACHGGAIVKILKSTNAGNMTLCPPHNRTWPCPHQILDLCTAFKQGIYLKKLRRILWIPHRRSYLQPRTRVSPSSWMHFFCK